MRFEASVPGLTLISGSGEPPAWQRNITPDEILAIATRADELGYDAISVSWHLVMKLGAPLANFGPRWPHSLSAAGFLLGATRRIRIQPKLVVPCEPPVAMAKAIATLDWMSGGRVTPILMAGYIDWEFEMLGVPLAERGAIMDEYVEAMIELWSSDTPSYHGRYVQFDDIAFEPKPRQQPLALWFGGRARPALRRIARFGSGWASYATPHTDMRETIAYIRNQPEFLARPRPLEVSAHFVGNWDPVAHLELPEPRVIVGNDAVMEQLSYLASIGVGMTGVPVGAKAGPRGGPTQIDSAGEYIERLEWFAEEIMPQARGLEPAAVV